MGAANEPSSKSFNRALTVMKKREPKAIILDHESSGINTQRRTEVSKFDFAEQSNERLVEGRSTYRPMDQSSMAGHSVISGARYLRNDMLEINEDFRALGLLDMDQSSNYFAQNNNQRSS